MINNQQNDDYQTWAVIDVDSAQQWEVADCYQCSSNMINNLWLVIKCEPLLLVVTLKLKW